ncbi:hypothetical protein ERUR111494_08870 [Erysipelothrix urinaevulpis]|uniref:hypothetical protein n=1 Tax=Erysipelothrix urinaevulpis TaxID=2683717 RepID=UPI0013586696|nr:hypothetical protein [Erysipelothrix urinaevulpis]
MRIVKITSMGCMSCIIMDQRLRKVCKDLRLEWEEINADMEPIEPYNFIDTYPSILIIDEHGTIVSLLEGEVSESTLEKELRVWFNA